MPESTQHKLDRVRPPRVQITYDLETGGAFQQKELPFVVGIMSDLAGKPSKPLPRLKDRKFVSIDRDNFNDVMAAIGPRVAFQVEDKLSGEEGKQIPVELNFKSMDDFAPVNIVDQVPALKKLYEARTRLTDLLAKLDGNDALDSLLQEVAGNKQGLEELKQIIGGGDNGQES
jgi:type VI secretion system protein ImpB